MIIITDYDSNWPGRFEVLRASLLQVLGALALRIDHIGSTSVPGLGAKDIIDIQVTVHELTLVTKQKLIGAGYICREDITHDHVPLGEDSDPRLWAKFFFYLDQLPGKRLANIHLRINGNPNQRYALLFRDYLRAHPNSARSIELMKREIAKRHADDIVAYLAIKDPAYDLIWDAAQEWARYTDWKPA